MLVLSETYRWTGDIKLLQKYRKVAEACLDWIDHYGDLGPCSFTLHFWREGNRSRWEVVDMKLNPGIPHEEAIEVVDEP